MKCEWSEWVEDLVDTQLLRPGRERKCAPRHHGIDVAQKEGGVRVGGVDVDVAVRQKPCAAHVLKVALLSEWDAAVCVASLQHRGPDKKQEARYIGHRTQGALMVHSIVPQHRTGSKGNNPHHNTHCTRRGSKENSPMQCHREHIFHTQYIGHSTYKQQRT